MITLGAKVYFGLSAFALVAAAVLGLASGGTLLGIVSFGWSGAVGDNLGYTVLLGTSAAAFFMGVVTTAFRDADASAVEEVAGTDTLPAALPPAHLSPWPVVAAFGVAAVVIGLVVDTVVTGVGVAVLIICAIEWCVTAWADQATGDPDTNLAIRTRIMQPVEVPAISVIAIIFFVFFASRLLLALTKWGSIAVFSAVAIAIFAAAALLAARPKVSRGVLTALLLLGGVTLLVGGVVGIGLGHREFHHAGDHAASEHDEAGEQTTDGEHDESTGDGATDGTDDGGDTSSGDSEE